MTLRVDEESLVGACGVSVLYEFKKGDEEKYWLKDIRTLVPQAGCGWVCAGFIAGNELCDAMFQACLERGPLMYKSPIKKNRNSGHRFYFAMFDWSKTSRKYGFDHAEEDDEEDE